MFRQYFLPRENDYSSKDSPDMFGSDCLSKPGHNSTLTHNRVTAFNKPDIHLVPSSPDLTDDPIFSLHRPLRTLQYLCWTTGRLHSSRVYLMSTLTGGYTCRQFPDITHRNFNKNVQDSWVTLVSLTILFDVNGLGYKSWECYGVGCVG